MSEVSVEAPLVRVSLRSGKLEIRAIAGAALALEGGGRLQPRGAGREFEVAGAKPSARLILTCPPGTHLIAGSESGEIQAQGELGSVRITTGTGKVRIEKADRVDVRSGTGAVEVDGCRQARVMAGTGKVTIGSADRAEITAATGAVVVSSAGQLAVKTASGAIDVAVTGNAAVESHSGAVTIRVLGGRRPSVRLRSISGNTRNDCPEGEDLLVQAQTIKGDIEVVPA